ncbi:MAG: ATP synthase subunit I [Planctomycetota bacterium]|jgi:O-antigen/teichoic acid export membrane protein|nr:ATP synthase subunit I [Planctomycetota bacterium]MDP7250857.1 ATP synthase subunit I [Planctomycetota bacterium]
MKADFISKVLNISLVFAGLGFLFVSSAFGFDIGLGYLFGAVWSALNLWGMAKLIRTVFSDHENKKTIALAFMLKFPVLYGAGFLLLYYGKVHVIGAFVGFSIPLVIAVLKSGGKVLTAQGIIPDGQKSGTDEQTVPDSAGQAN